MRKIRMGMVGGGEGAFIGAVHRMAAALHGEVELVCAALSSDASRAARAAALLNLPLERSYSDWSSMLVAECALPAERRMEFVVIVTPNDLHVAIAEAALGAGFHVLSDKPASRNLAEARRLQNTVRRSGRLYALTYTYTGYPLIEEARVRVQRGDLGTLRRVAVDYVQGWLARDQPENRQAAWRLDPARAGISCCLSDIGTHAFNLLEYVTGVPVQAVCADVRNVVAGRVLDDDASVLLRLRNGARGVLTASQVCGGQENALVLRLFGELGSLEWQQQDPNNLWLRWADRPTEVIRTGAPWLQSSAAVYSNFPAGHPEGYLEAFANIYLSFAAAVRDFPNPRSTQLQDIDAGVRAMAFVEAALASSTAGSQWRELAT